MKSNLHISFCSLLLLAVSLWGLNESVLADDSYQVVYNPSLEVSTAAGAIKIDADLSDIGWKGAAKADHFAEHRPGDQVQPPVNTEAFITYDDKNLYVAFVAYDDNPSAIRATLSDRDQFFSDDNVILALDTYASAAWAYEFVVNPLGVQCDLVWSQYGDEDEAPDFIWESAGKITDSGYQVELAIPFTSLRFPDKEEQVWKAEFWRNYPRETRYQMSWAAYKRGLSCWPCQWGTLTGIKNVKPGKGIEFLPQTIGFQSGELSDHNDPYSDWKNDKVDGEVSIGMKYAISSNATAELTFNPDYSQIESDAAQVDVNTTYALFFPEKRPFFQEGIDLLRPWGNIVYTRSINNPSVAAKYINRTDKQSIAYLFAYDEDSPVIIPLEERSITELTGGSTSNIVRARQSVGKESHIGGILTDRRYKGGGYNSVYGFDGALYFWKSFNFEFQALASSTEEIIDTALFDTTVEKGYGISHFDNGNRTVALDGESFKGHSYYAGLSKSGRHWWFENEYNEESPTFRADNGFVTRNGNRRISISSGYVINYITKIFDDIQPSFNYGRIWTYHGGHFKDEWLIVFLSSQLKAQTSVQISALTSREEFRGIYFSNIVRYGLNINSNFSDPARMGFNLMYGRTITRNLEIPEMGWETLFEMWWTIKPTNKLTVEPTYTFTQSKDVETDELFYNGYIFRSRFTYQFNKALSCRLVLQYNDFARDWNIDPLISYRLSPFSVFYVGAASSLIDYDKLGIKQVERQFFFKLQYLFRI